MDQKIDEETIKNFFKGFHAHFGKELESFNKLLTAFLYQGFLMDSKDLEKSLDIIEITWRQVFNNHKKIILINHEEFRKELLQRGAKTINDMESNETQK